MSKRALALRLAVVGVVAATGVGIAASPASAAEKECYIFAYWNARSADMLGDRTLTGAQWLKWFDLWVQTEIDLENC